MKTNRLLSIAFCLAAGPTGAVERLALEIDGIVRGGIEANGILVEWHTQPGGALAVSAAGMTLPGLPYPLENVRLTCDSVEVTTSLLRCADGRLRFQAGGRTWNAGFAGRHDRRGGATSIEVNGLAAGGGSVDVQGSFDPAGWRLRLGTRDAGAADLAALLPEALTQWQWSGAIDLSLTASGDPTGLTTASIEASVSEFGFSDPSGLRAAEALTASTTIDVEAAAGGWRVSGTLQSPAGQVYLDPVFADIAAHPLDATLEARFHPQRRELDLPAFHLTLEGLLNAHGEGIVDTADGGLQAATITLDEARFPAAYTTLARPFLLGGAAGDLNMAGTASGHLQLDADGLRSLRATLNRLDVADNAGRFTVDGLGGEINWRRPASGDTPPTRLTWDDGKLYGLALGPAELNALSEGDTFRLLSPLELPVLDGALRINRFALENALSDERQALLDAELLPLSLRRLTESLGWPAFSGELSGVLPELAYSDGVARLGGEFVAQAFGGELRIEGLSLTDPLGAVPELSADVRLRDLSLEAVTNAFAFGQITGTLEGDVDDLRLVGWQPASFRAWFHTPERDGVAHRISQRAVENLASLGGAGAAAALSRGFMRFFENFSYDRIGLGCTLRGNICEMRGLEPDNGGYVIVRGQGLPRIDVVGFSQQVSWPVLMQQIIDITRGGPPVVD